MKHSSAPVTKYRKDYLPSDFLIDHTHLKFELFDDHALVHSELMLRRNPKGNPKAQSIRFHGEELALQNIAINEESLGEHDYQIDEEGLTLNKVADQFTLKTTVKIVPQKNTSLEGLYTSGGKFCTQCEAEGFRKITYYLDRPDVLAKFSVRIEADKATYPLLLSNGNPVGKGELDNERHFVEWEDPFPKPSYLFALVAGDLDLLEDTFVTKSGRKITLQLFVDKGKLDQSEFAMASLINSMKWDEQRYDLEYDLDLYMIVAVGDFNMGAMENKGLNIFNTKYVLANPQTATDQDFENVESVIGHEYFHNWTGNRVTCRDWFQLSLKEGLTVFRDQQFTEDMRSKAVKRIDDVKVIRSYQFAEDAGPMAHPIRPDEYIEMNNFYTVTVYNKGAEVIRMYHTLLGEQGFQKGMKLYFERHDGDAATCDDFVAAMADANGYDLSQFKRWYSQAGTPTLSVQTEYSADSKTMTLSIKQSNAHPSASEPYHIPLKVGLIAKSGASLSFEHEGETKEETLIHVKDFEQKVTLTQVAEDCVPSLLRDFSAPVKLATNLSDNDLAFLFAFDTNTFTRWDAGQQLMQKYCLGDDALLPLIEKGFVQILEDQSIDNAFKARALAVPDLKTLFEANTSLSVDELIQRRRDFVSRLATELKDIWLDVYQLNHVAGDTDLEQPSVGKRSIKNLALSYLSKNGDEFAELAARQMEQAKLMTDELGALGAAVRNQLNNAERLTQTFYDKWHHEALVMDKWIGVQACVDHENVFDTVEKLKQSPVFSIKNPNKVRALYSSFAALNFSQFHRADGKGYQLIADAIMAIDGFNAQVAANLSKQFSSAAKLDNKRQSIIRSLLEKIKAKPELSKDVFEVVSKTLSTIE